MSGYKPHDLERLGPGAKAQIDAFRFACAEAERQKDALDRPRSRNKYGNVRTEAFGRVFDSKLEAARYAELRLLQRSGRISNLICQPEFPITVNGFKIAVYIADFSYFDSEGRQIVEDVKSPCSKRIPVYALKKKLVLAVLGITITEIGV